MLEWDRKKNEEIKRRHGISFERLTKYIENEMYVIIEVPNKKRTQNAFLISVNDYPYIVPFEYRDGVIRLITAWPDRRYKNE